jgi:hypothetical protein
VSGDSGMLIPDLNGDVLNVKKVKGLDFLTVNHSLLTFRHSGTLLTANAIHGSFLNLLILTFTL